MNANEMYAGLTLLRALSLLLLYAPGYYSQPNAPNVQSNKNYYAVGNTLKCIIVYMMLRKFIPPPTVVAESQKTGFMQPFTAKYALQSTIRV